MYGYRDHKIPIVTGFFVTVAHLISSAAISSASGSERPPNIVIIVADDLGYADVGFNGCTDFDTPHLDALAASGVQLTDGYVTHPYCSPSRAAILTGRYQQRFGHESNPPYAPNDESIGTPTNELFLSQLLKERGYRNAMIGKWHLGDAPRLLPSQRGFDEFFGFTGGHYDYYGVPSRGRPGDLILRNDQPFDTHEIGYLTDDFSDEAIAFIERNTAQPFLLFLSYNAVHSPDQAPGEYLARSEHIGDPFRCVYAAMTMAMDDGIGRVLEALEQHHLRQNTLVVFFSDNGGRIGSDNRPLRGHKGLLYEGGIRVPFVMSWPGRLPAGARFEQPASALDIFPTAAAVAGAATSPDQRLDGVDLLPYLCGESTGVPHERLFWRVLGGEGYAIRQGPYKLIRAVGHDRDQLFNLVDDPREQFDISAEQPAMTEELRNAYSVWNRELIEPLWTDAHAENVRKHQAAVFDARARALPVDERAPGASPQTEAPDRLGNVPVWLVIAGGLAVLGLLCVAMCRCFRRAR